MADHDSPIIDITARQPGRGAKGQGRDFATKDDVIAAMAAGSLAIGQKVYDQLAAQTSAMLTDMEATLRAEFDAKLAAVRDETGCGPAAVLLDRAHVQ